MIKGKNKIHPRLKWFFDRVGKRVYRNKVSCKCDTCVRVYKEGLLLSDRDHADYVCMCEGESNLEGVPLRYFDTIEERDKFEKTLVK